MIKEGKDITLARVMETARLGLNPETYHRMQEKVKVNYVQYGKGSKKGRSRPSGGSSSSSGVNAGKPSKLTGNGRKPPLPTDIC